MPIIHHRSKEQSGLLLQSAAELLDENIRLRNALGEGVYMDGTWRVGRSIPLNVYCGDRPVCQCHNAEDAYVIVSAMNRMTKERNGTM